MVEPTTRLDRRVVYPATRGLVPARLTPDDTHVRDLEVLIRSHHALIHVQSSEPERAATLVQWVADKLRLPYVSWAPGRGFSRVDVPTQPVPGGESAQECLSHILNARGETVYHLHGFASLLTEPAHVHMLTQIAHKLSEHRGAIVITDEELDLPPALRRFVTRMKLSAPKQTEYYDFVRRLLRDLRSRMPIEVAMSSEEVSQLLAQLQGLTLFEVKKVVTRAIVEERRFDKQVIKHVAQAKKEIIERSGVLEYFATDDRLSDIAGLDHLKAWLAERKVAFTHPDHAKSYGLTAPRGLLLLGVQGCGKSLCAKAIAHEWQLPLIRLDPSTLYQKYFGETEKNLKRAIDTAESMAPIVLWIDEMEKAFGHGDDNDSGTGQRVFGTFLSWMQEKQDGVFVIATSNDIERLPPELVRKGRFDEIFFVDLPSTETRAAIFSVHLARRGRDPKDFDLGLLAERTHGFSGSEIEQVVIASLYTCFATHKKLTTDALLNSIDRTIPLSVTAAEKIHALRTWAQSRTVLAG